MTFDGEQYSAVFASMEAALPLVKFAGADMRDVRVYQQGGLVQIVFPALDRHGLKDQITDMLTVWELVNPSVPGTAVRGLVSTAQTDAGRFRESDS